MPRASLKDMKDDPADKGLDEFKPENGRERVTKDVPEEADIQPGWSTDIRPRQSGSGIPRFTVDKEAVEYLVAFLDAKPFAPVFQHWIMTTAGRRPFVCLVGKDCPMCARGDKSKGSDWFNIVEMYNPDDDKNAELPRVKIWSASPDPAAAIREKADGRRTSPLNKPDQYFAVQKREGTNKIPTYTVDTVRADELEDWGVTPLTDEQKTAFRSEAFDASVVKRHTRQELEAIAQQYLD